MIRTRRGCPEISWGKVTVLAAGAAEVLILKYTWRSTELVVVHNFAAAPRVAAFELGPDAERLVDVFRDDSLQGAGGAHQLELEPYGYRWFRVGSADNALNRSAI